MVSVPTSRLSSGAVTGALDGLCCHWQLWGLDHAVSCNTAPPRHTGRQAAAATKREVSSSQGMFTGRVCCRKGAQEVGLRGVMGSGTSVARQLDRDG